MTDWGQRLGFWWISEDHPTAPAILAGPDGPRTYAELAGDAHQLAHLFRHRGAGTGDAVAVMADNGNTLIECQLACQESGLYFIPLNTHLTAAEIAAILDHSGAKVLVAGQRFVDMFDDLDLDDVSVLLVGPGTDRFASLAAARADMPRTEPAERSPGGMFVYTSGTTGKPKGIRRPLGRGDVGELSNMAAVFGRAFDFRPFDGPMLVSTGMFHGGSLSYYMGGLNVGHALVIMDRFDAERTLGLIEQYRIRTGYMVPTQFHRLLQLPEAVKAKYDLSSLHAIVHSAAPCPRTVKEQMMAWWGPVIWETYGGMEGAATIAKPQRWLEKPGTVGRAIRGTRLFVLDEDGNELPPGDVGAIYLENGVGFEYLDDPEQTAAAHRGARFSLGDVGHLDEDGYLFISDRVKDMIITGGTNVYPAEIESVLLTHPDVHDVAVVGVPDPDWGETVVAVVAPTAAASPGDELGAALIAYCRERLATFKCPRAVHFRSELPRTEAGKLAKKPIREALAAEATA